MAKEIMEKSKQDLIRATKSRNINVDYIAKAYMILSDIYMSENNIKSAEWGIKKALRANRNNKCVKEKLRNINKIKFQSLENYK